MSMEKEALRRVQDGLFHLQRGLTPFVAARMKGVHGANWLHYASRAHGSSPSTPLDTYGLVKTMLDRWREVFDDAFGRGDKHKARNFASMALEARNATSHLAFPIQDDEALRYLDAMHQLLRLVKASEKEVAELKSLYEAQRSSGVTKAAAPAPIAPAPTLAIEPAATADGPARALKPWIEVALPHPDVLANRFKEAEFAADLFAVDSGNATEDYATPENFFRITFLTEGLKRVLLSALQRLGKVGGDPVIGLQTAFGGGKTHTMLAVLHLAKANDLSLLEGVAPLVAQAGLKGWTKPKVAVFVGSSKGTDTSLNLKDGPKVHTLWGYIAWRIAGDAGLKLVADAEAARTNPGSELMVEVFRLAGPSAILLDELVAYARQLPDDRFEAFLSFIQSLTEAAKMVPGILIVGSLPESDLEAGGDKGVQALRRLQAVFGRVHSTWLPAAGNETYEIIRRRLFQAFDSEGEKAREETAKAFHELYKKNPAEFPPEAKEARYFELLRLSYPIHPELFDRLSKDWASLEKFQRTRGVLRFMANVVGVLWHAQVRDPLITPGRVPIAHERIRASVLYPLDSAFGAVVDKEVDGDGALPSRLEANPSRRISQLRAATRASRAVFLCSAPLVGQPNAGLTGPGLRLACAEPGEQLAIFREALQEVAEKATYLYEEAGRYWFSTQPTLNRLADERAKALPEYKVDEEIVRVLREDGAGTKAGFSRVFSAPDDPVSIDEAQALSLVILGPSTAHSGKGAGKSAATDIVTDTLMRCRSSQRRYRNTLVFVAADEAQLGTVREVVRKALAWAEIVSDGRLQQQMTKAQTADAVDKAKTSKDGALKAIRAAWAHVLYPEKDASSVTGSAFSLEHLSIVSKERGPIPAAVYDKLKADGIAKERLGPDALWLHLKPLWPDDRPHLPVSELADWFASYVYLPKIRDRVVLDTAIRDAVGKLDAAFAYADDADATSGRYSGLALARTPPDIFPATAVVVRADVAGGQIAATPKPSATGLGGVSPSGPAPTSNGGEPAAGKPSGPRKPKRFYGTVELDMVRPVKAFDAVLNAVVMELQRAKGAKVKITVEIEAEAPEGFDDGDVGVVRDNARQLKFKADSTGFSDE